jgi:hypothetical protein
MHDTLGDTPAAQSATMGGMGWGKKRQNAKAQTAATARIEPDSNADPHADTLHFCCICGALLGIDLEDELNGEGWGRDICGDCNRTKNDEALMGF